MIDMCYKYADYIIRKYNNDENQRFELSNKRLQKILFIASVKYALDNNGERMFSDDFEAWSYGPVMSEIYRDYSIFQFGFMFPLSSEKILETKKAKVLNEVFELTKNISTEKLIENAHIKGSPWDFYFEENKDKKYKIIDHKTIYEYYSKNGKFNELLRNEENV